jgi:hypothetical protein
MFILQKMMVARSSETPVNIRQQTGSSRETRMREYNVWGFVSPPRPFPSKFFRIRQ